MLWTTAVLVVGQLSPGTPTASPYPDFAVRPMPKHSARLRHPATSRIHVDQFGYPVAAEKWAVISNPEQGYNAMEAYTPGPTLQVRKFPGEQVVFTGPTATWNSGTIHADSGDRGWWFNFSALQAPGDYFIFDPTTNYRSAIFRVGHDAYDTVLRTATRVFYYQRLSTPIQAPFAQAPWIVPAYMTQDTQARFVNDKNNPATTKDLSGGWMDAGDTNKYPPFNAEPIQCLLYAYKANPGAFGDNFGIPESGNGLPDLLDELKFQLEWLKKMQEADGGVYIKMGHVVYGNPNAPRYYGPKCTGATITTAMNFAHAARVYAQFPQWQSFAADLRARAELAWTYYKNNPRTTNLDTGEIKSGIANRSLAEQDRLEAFAAFHLWALTGNTAYHDAARAKAGTTRQLSEWIWSPYEGGMAEVLGEYTTMAGANPQLVTTIRTKLRDSARNGDFNPTPDSDLYRSRMTSGSYHWGSNMVRSTLGISALMASRYGSVTTAERGRLQQRARDLIHAMHGVNPMTAVMMSNMARFGAELSMQRLYHERWGYGTPFAGNPAPGYVVGGPNQNFTGIKGDQPGEVDWIKAQPRAKAYADFDDGWPKASWEISEPAIYYQAAYIRLLAEVMKRP